MKKLFFAAALVGLSAAPTLAADMAPATYTKAPVYAPVYNWTGFYIGANVGYGFGRDRTSADFRNPATGVVLFSGTNTNNTDGVFGGGQIGYNWQSSSWVYGIEADFQGSGRNGRGAVVCPGGICGAGAAFPLTLTTPGSADTFGTVRARLGYTITPTIMGYVTGGYAIGGFNRNDTVLSGFNAVPAGVSVSGTGTDWKSGWTIGGGIEGVVSGNWTAKIEYLYTDYANINGGLVLPANNPIGGHVLFTTDNKSSLVRLGLNYRFSNGKY